MAFHLQPVKKPLTQDEEIDAFVDYASDSEELQQKAINTLVEANIALVYKVAHEFKKSSLDFEDLVSEGCIGLLYAISKFDITKGTKFITYAIWWIKQKMRRAIELQSRTVRVPQTMTVLRAKYLRAKAELKEAFGEEPSSDDIAEFLDLTKDQLSKIESSLNFGVSLEDDSSETSKSLENTLSDNEHADIASSLFSDEIREKAFAAIKTLSKRDQLILNMRFGLNGYEEANLEVCAQEIGRCRERVRQLEEDALERLREAMGIGCNELCKE